MELNVLIIIVKLIIKNKWNLAVYKIYLRKYLKQNWIIVKNNLRNRWNNKLRLIKKSIVLWIVKYLSINWTFKNYWLFISYSILDKWFYILE
jgi:hypothetical protein